MKKETSTHVPSISTLRSQRALATISSSTMRGWAAIDVVLLVGGACRVLGRGSRDHGLGVEGTVTGDIALRVLLQAKVGCEANHLPVHHPLNARPLSRACPVTCKPATRQPIES